MNLFHVTARKNLQSILTNGLIPLKSQGLTMVWPPRTKCVWLTSDFTYILDTQCGIDWIKRNDPAILKVDCDGLDVVPYIAYATGKLVPHEYQYFGIIGSMRIKQYTLESSLKSSSSGYSWEWTYHDE